MKTHPTKIAPGAVLVDGGNFDLCVPMMGPPEWLTPPSGPALPARVTEGAVWCFTLAARETSRLQRLGVDARLGFLLGDIKAPPGLSAVLGPWALPIQFRQVLVEEGLRPDDVVIQSERGARNRGKSLLNRARNLRPEVTYETAGWALFRESPASPADDDHTVFLSVATLEWEGMAWSRLVRSTRPLCSLIIAGYKFFMAREGRAHIGYYSLEDDPDIGRKLRAGAHIHEAFSARPMECHRHRVVAGPTGTMPREVIVRTGDAVAPASEDWTSFLREVVAVNDRLSPVQRAVSAFEPAHL